VLDQAFAVTGIHQMTLLNPAGLFFAGLVPVIILLYLLKLRREPAQVSTLMFWQRVVADNQRRALFQRLRQLLSLLLHLLIFALLLLALARPELRAFHGGVDGLATIVVLDARARMQTQTDGGGATRFSEASRIAGRYLERASNRQPVALISLDSVPRVVCGSTGDGRVLLDALAGLRPSDAGGRLEDAVQLARDLLAAEKVQGRVVVVTDQAFTEPAPAMAAGGKSAAEIETRLLDNGGAPRENVGIVRLDARPLPGSPETDEVLIEIGNFGAQRQAGSVELTFEGRLIDVKPFDLAPGERRTDVYPALAAQTGIANARGWLTAHLTHQGGGTDALPLDDDAYAVIPPPRPIRVLLVTRGDFFLENLLKADESVQFDQLAPEAFQPAQAAGFDAVIFDDNVPPGFATGPDQLPPGNFLFVNSAPFLAGAGTQAPPLEHPLVTDVEAASPLLRRVNLRDVTILRAQTWRLPESGGSPPPAAAESTWTFRAPVRSFDHPLVVEGERRVGNADRPSRLVGLAFGVADSDLPLRVAFPLFIHNALEWLADRDESASANEAIQAGGVIDVPTGARLWRQPQRGYQPLGQIPAAEWVIGPGSFQPQANGFYLLRSGDGDQRWVAVDTLDPAMSAINISTVPAPIPNASPTPDRPVFSEFCWDIWRAWPPWMELALLAFVLCTLEWWSFHRRRTE
jgi:hypothetical protein